jgi:HEAT repeat protein
VRALDVIDHPDGVAAIRLRLKSEPDLRMKLDMARVLGRHGIQDGYAFALEHLADPGITTYAASALAAIDDERTSGQLWKNLETSHDNQWNAAALYGLAALKDARVGEQLATILADRQDPNVLAAITAAHKLGDPELIASVSPYMLSRNDEVAAASVAAIKYLAAKARDNGSQGEQVGQAGKQLLEVLNDQDIQMNLRIAALDALHALQDDRLPAALLTLADYSPLENTELMQRIDLALASP